MKKLFNKIRTALAVFVVGTWGVFALMALAVVALFGLLYGFGLIPFELAMPGVSLFVLVFVVMAILDNKVF
jgi:hypothetical protein